MNSLTDKVAVDFNNKTVRRKILYPKYIQKRMCAKTADERQKKTSDILPRLETNDAIQSIIDIDPDFYRIVSGRPIKPSKSIREFKESIRKTTLSKVCRNFFEEERLRFEQEMKEEKVYFDNISHQFEQYKQNFDAYLAEDHTKTMEIVKNSASISKQLSKCKDVHRLQKRELAFARSQIRFTEENLKTSLTIAIFFREISPLFWTSGSCNDFKIIDHIIELPLDIDTPFDFNELEMKLDKIGHPVIHFKKPKELLSVFQALEDQNLNCLIAAEFLNIKIERIFKIKNKLNQVCNKELKEVQSQVDQITKVIEREEERVKELESTYQYLLNGMFKHLVSSKTTLHLYNDIIHVFETILTQNEVDFSIKDMVAMLEKEYEILSLQIDAFDLENINYSKKYVFAEELKSMREARKANKILRKITRMKNILSSAFDVPKNTNKELKYQ